MSKQMKWYDRVTGDDTVNAVAARSGLVGSTLSRQVKAQSLTPETIVAVARAYDADPIEGLIAAGLITEEDVKRHGAKVVLADLTDRMLADEVWGRMAEGRGVREFDGPRRLEVITGDKAAQQPGYNASSETEQ